LLVDGPDLEVVEGLSITGIDDVVLSVDGHVLAREQGDLQERSILRRLGDVTFRRVARSGADADAVADDPADGIAHRRGAGSAEREVVTGDLAACQIFSGSRQEQRGGILANAGLDLSLEVEHQSLAGVDDHSSVGTETETGGLVVRQRGHHGCSLVQPRVLHLRCGRLRDVEEQLIDDRGFLGGVLELHRRDPFVLLEDGDLGRIRVDLGVGDDQIGVRVDVVVVLVVGVVVVVVLVAVVVVDVVVVLEADSVIAAGHEQTRHCETQKQILELHRDVRLSALL